MSARGFKPVGWVAAVAGAALGCYMLSLNVAAERAELASVERGIIAAKQDIRSLQTELGTRGRLAQLDRWNADVLALSAPTSSQFLEDAFTLARFDRREKTIEERAKIQLASADAGKPQAEARNAIATAEFESADPMSGSQPIVRQVAYVPSDGQPFRPIRATAVEPSLVKPAAYAKPRLLDARLIAEIGAAARSEKNAEGGAGGQ